MSVLLVQPGVAARQEAVFLRWATSLRLFPRQAFMCRSAAAVTSYYCLFAFLVIRPRCLALLGAASPPPPCVLSRQHKHKQNPAAVIKAHWLSDMLFFWLTQIRWHFMDIIGQRSALVFVFRRCSVFFFVFFLLFRSLLSTHPTHSHFHDESPNVDWLI